MSLIEKVAKRLEKNPGEAKARRPERPSDEDGSHGGDSDDLAVRARPARTRRVAAVRKRTERQADLEAETDSQGVEAPYAARTMDIEFATLETKGIISPATTNERYARDVRAIKRRLLARTKFFSAGKGAPGASERGAKTLNADRQNKVVITSSSPGEGKTFFAMNLALSLVIEERANVLLIDADVPRASLTSLLGLDSEIGLTDKLTEPDIDLSEVLLQEGSLPLMFMPRGRQIPSPIALFNNESTPDLLQRIARGFRDYLVIIDTPPMLASAGTDILAKYADQVVFLVEAGVTKESTITSAIELLPDTDKVNLVLNKSFTSDDTAHFGNLYGYYGYYPDAPVQPEGDSIKG